jgi:hypothetical protein
VKFKQTYGMALGMLMSYGRLVAGGGSGHPVAVFNIAIASLVCADTVRDATLSLVEANPLTALIVCLDLSKQAKAAPGLYLVPGDGTGAVFDRRLLTTYARDLLPLSSVVSSVPSSSSFGMHGPPTVASMATSATSMFMEAPTAAVGDGDPDRALHPISATVAIGVVGAHFGCEVVPWCSGTVIRFPIPSKPRPLMKIHKGPPQRPPKAALVHAFPFVEEEEEEEDVASAGAAEARCVPSFLVEKNGLPTPLFVRRGMFVEEEEED